METKKSSFKNSQLLEVNKLVELEKIGNFLWNGEFDSLFSLVGLINQTDPYQNYLKDGELIFKERLKQNVNNYDYLYKIEIARTLQKKSKIASNTLDKLIKFDENNANLYLDNQM